MSLMPEKNGYGHKKCCRLRQEDATAYVAVRILVVHTEEDWKVVCSCRKLATALASCGGNAFKLAAHSQANRNVPACTPLFTHPRQMTISS